MIVGVPREIKTAENRVALVPAGVESLVGDGHSVLVEQGAGIGSGFADETYRAAGGTLVPKAADVWAKAEMVVKVKEPIEPEWPCMRKGQVVFTYFHFAASESLTQAVIKSGIVAIAYETVQLASGELPLLLPGAKAPKLVRREDLKLMKPGSVIVDVAVDQGGCIETSKPTTHENPVYVVDGIIHYAVANMPGGVPRTSTLGLTNATFPYAKRLARHGWKQACKDDPALFLGLNVIDGKVVYPAVAEAFGLPSADPKTLV